MKSLPWLVYVCVCLCVWCLGVVCVDELARKMIRRRRMCVCVRASAGASLAASAVSSGLGAGVGDAGRQAGQA